MHLTKEEIFKNTGIYKGKELPAILKEREKVRRILLIKLQHFGDVLLTTPILSTLKMNYPNCLIDVLLYKNTEQMLSCNKDVNNVYTIDRDWKKMGRKTQIAEEYALLKKVSSEKYDLVINLSGQMRMAVYIMLMKPRFSIGYRHRKRNNWLWKNAHDILVDTNDHTLRHTVLNNLDILFPLGLPEISSAVTMCYGQGDVDFFNNIAKENNLVDYILIQPTARWYFKTWKDEYFSQLINHLTEKGQRIILTAANNEKEIASINNILSGCKHKDMIINMSGKVSFSQLAILIKNAKLFIGVDSVPMHMAAALQTPSVVLFGPSNIKQWYPWQAPHKMLWAGDYRALPYYTEIDTNTEERYLEAIPVEDVIKAAEEYINK